MRLLKIVGMLTCALVMIAMASAGTQNLGIREVYHVTFARNFPSACRGLHDSPRNGRRRPLHDLSGAREEGLERKGEVLTGPTRA